MSYTFTSVTNLWCTVCHCWANECVNPEHAIDFYMTPEQIARDEAISAEEDRWEDKRL